MSKEHDLTDAQVLRTKAEEKLKLKPKNSTATYIETDVNRLVHELQVHQIELEMQNEELRLANDRAESALKKYTMMYDFAPMGYFTLDKNGQICELNFTGAEMLGERRFKLVNSNFKLFVSNETLPAFNDFLNKVFLVKSKETCEVMLGKDAESLCHVYIEAIVMAGDEQCLLSAVDISMFAK